MKLKIILTILFNVLFQKNICEITNVLFLENGAINLCILADYHGNKNVEKKQESQFIHIHQWLEKINRRTKFIIEREKSESKKGKISEQDFKILLSKKEYQNLSSKLMLFALTNNLNFNHIQFDFADIREDEKISPIIRILLSKKLSIEDSVFNKKEILEFKKYIEHIKTNEIKILYERNNRLLNTKFKKLVENLIIQLELDITKWLSGINIDIFPQLKNKELIWNGIKIALINFADIGYILSILEAIDGNHKQIIIHVGLAHIIRIINFFENIGFRKLNTFPQGIIRFSNPTAIEGKDLSKILYDSNFLQKTFIRSSL